MSFSKQSRGITLIELLVTLVILSILATVALPYAEVTIRRGNEIELRRALRDIRDAIDAFHQDWLAGLVSDFDSVASEDGYPVSLEILVAGIVVKGDMDRKKRYLRRIPRDPIAQGEATIQQQWVLRGYQDDVDALIWGGEDVYDIRTASQLTAIDGSQYEDW